MHHAIDHMQLTVTNLQQTVAVCECGRFSQIINYGVKDNTMVGSSKILWLRDGQKPEHMG